MVAFSDNMLVSWAILLISSAVDAIRSTARPNWPMRSEVWSVCAVACTDASWDCWTHVFTSEIARSISPIMPDTMRTFITTMEAVFEAAAESSSACRKPTTTSRTSSAT
jgi:hypothetical protein